MIILVERKVITKIIEQTGGKSTRIPASFFTSKATIDLGVLITKSANEQLDSMKEDPSTFSGNPHVALLMDREELEYPDELRDKFHESDQRIALEDHVYKLLTSENLAIKLETATIGGIFKWLPKDEQLLLVTVFVTKSTSKRHQDMVTTPVSLRVSRGQRNESSYSKQAARLLHGVFLELRKRQREKFDEGYRRFLDVSFRPFEDFLYHERISIRDPVYRPKCKYIKREVNEKEDRAYIEVQDPPRQMTEGGNAVVPVNEDKKGRFLSARILDYDEFEQVLIFDEGYRVKDWPNEGTLILEGDMASNRRKWDAIKQLKSRQIPAYANLADVLIRPWGLLRVLPVARTYFNPGITHDSTQAKAQAHAIDMALATPDVALIHGPPGTGKTTVIIEIIRHVTASGGRVIMCAPTHVAVDNVLERIQGIKGISAVRVGGRPYMGDDLVKFKLQVRARSLQGAMPSLVPVKEGYEPIRGMQQDFIQQMESKGPKFLENLTINQANLVCGTTIGIARYEPPADNPVDFDVLIIDEASKATVMEFLVPAVRAKKWILVGDHRQLPPYVNEQEIRIYVQRYFDRKDQDDEKVVDDDGEQISIYNDRTNDLIASLRRFHEELHAMGEGETKWHWQRIVEMFDFAKKPIRSIEEMVNFALGSCFHYFLQRVDESRNARLEVQHRMPSILANFLAQAIYKGHLKTSDSAATHGLTLPTFPTLHIKSINAPMQFISTEAMENRGETSGKYKGYYNTAEAEVIAELITQLVGMDVESLGYSNENPMTIGVITYYARQSREINYTLRTIDELEKERGWRYRVPGKPVKVRVSIVDRFQGQEQDIVILSLTRSNTRNSIGFLKNLQRINVSLSRAKQNLLIVGDAQFFKNVKIRPTPIMKQLAKYCQKHHLVQIVKMEADRE